MRDMSYVDAKNILDERREGADMPEEVVTRALELTGDIDYDLHRLPGCDDNPGPLETLQLTTLRFLLGATDSTTRQAADTDKRADSCTAQGSACGRGGMGIQRAGDTQAGENESYSGTAAGRER